MSAYLTLQTTRTTRPDPVAMLTAIRAVTGDPTATLITLDGTTGHAKKTTDWTPAQIASAQNILDTAAPLTPRLAAQRDVDNITLMLKALVLALVDEINILRTHASIALPARTPQQAITAIRNKIE